jgi:N-acetylglucosamine-6-phosphate deacetylase
LEGPWINKDKKGAHIGHLIHSPAVDEVRELIQYGKGVIRLITLAPEICSKEIIDLLLTNEIRISAGHSNATYLQAKNGFENGIGLVTHLFNAMSPFLHREPGLAGAAMDDERVMASIIPDGYHVDFAALRVAKKAMGERLFAITDAVTATTKGYYQHQAAGDKYESEGILSGSALTMNKALKNLVRNGIELKEALRMCSLYPARAIGINNRIGNMASGYLSDMVVLGNDLEIVTIIN